MRLDNLLRWCTAAAMACALGCGDEGADTAPAVGPEGEGISGPAPSFNYVPLNDNVCEPTGEDAQMLSIGKKLNELNLDYNTAVASGLQLCTTCEDNGLLSALNAVGNNTVQIGETTVHPPLAAHFNLALAYPYRELLVAWKADEDGDFDIALAQGIRTNPLSYEAQVESLADGCEDFDISMFATVTTTGEGDEELTQAETASASDRPFGFIVPGTLPDMATASEEEIAEAVDAARGLSIAIEDPKVNFETTRTGHGAGTLTGYVQLGSLNALAEAGVDLTPFESEAGSGKVKAVLSFTMEPADVASAVDWELYEGTEADEEPASAPGKDAVEPTILGKQTICAGEETTEIDLKAVLIQGATGTFTIEGVDGMTPKISRKALGRGAVVQLVSTDESGENPVSTYTFRRPWRKGAGFAARPACVNQIAAGEATDELFPEDGWYEIRWRPAGDTMRGCSRSIWVCQQFQADKCGANTKLDEDGLCACSEGFQPAFDECIDPKTVATDGKELFPGAQLGKDEDGAVVVTCPDGLIGDGTTCVKNPCEDNPCGEAEVCTLKSKEEMAADASTVHTCEAMEEEGTGAAVMTGREMKAEFAKVETGEEGEKERVEQASVDDDDEQVSSDDTLEAVKEMAPEDGASEATDPTVGDGASKPGLGTQTGELWYKSNHRRRRRTRRKRMPVTVDVVVIGRTAQGQWKKVQLPARRQVNVGQAVGYGCDGSSEQLKWRVKRLTAPTAAQRVIRRGRGSKSMLDLRDIDAETWKALKELKTIRYVRYRTQRWAPRTYRGLHLKARPMGRAPWRTYRVGAVQFNKFRDRHNLRLLSQAPKPKYQRRARWYSRSKARRMYRKKARRFHHLSKAKRIKRLKRRWRMNKRRSYWGRRYYRRR